MKRSICALLSLALLLGLAACGQAPAPSGAGSAASASSVALAASAPAETQKPAVLSRIAGLKGPTTMGMVKLMSDAQQGTGGSYQVTTYGTADEIVPLLSKGELDMAALPANLAATLYQKLEGKVQVAAINTLGVLYVVSTGDEVKTVADLKGKTIYSTGKGTTPEYVLNYILAQNGLDPAADVTIEYKSEATEVLATLQTATGAAVAVLPQPYVTAAQMQLEGLNVALDLTAEWNKVSPESALVTGVLLVRTEFAQQHPEALTDFLSDYKASVEWVNANTAQAAQLVADYGIVAKAPIAEKALPACNITYIAGAEMKQKLQGYLQVLFDQAPASVGGELPDDGFYYGA